MIAWGVAALWAAALGRDGEAARIQAASGKAKANHANHARRGDLIVHHSHVQEACPHSTARSACLRGIQVAPSMACGANATGH